MLLGTAMKTLFFFPQIEYYLSNNQLQFSQTSPSTPPVSPRPVHLRPGPPKAHWLEVTQRSPAQSSGDCLWTTEKTANIQELQVSSNPSCKLETDSRLILAQEEEG